MNTDRSQYMAGLRQFADWLDANPGIPTPNDQRFLLALQSNPAVREFAARFDLEVATDAEGNLSADFTFGPIGYHVYGYVDFDAHVAADSERRARNWAAEKGLEFTAKTDA